MLGNNTGLNQFHRPGEGYPTTTVPAHFQYAPIALHLNGVIQQATANPVDHRTAAARTGSHGNTTAALPDAQTNMATVDNLDEMHIGFCGKQRMDFDFSAHHRDVETGQVIDKIRARGIAQAPRPAARGTVVIGQTRRRARLARSLRSASRAAR